MPKTDMLTDTRDQFNEALSQFLAALSVCFDRCPKIAVLSEAHKRLRASDDLVRQWHTHMKCHYADAVRKSDAFIVGGAPNPLLASLNIAEKWGNCDDETRDTIWEYVLMLNQLAFTYDLVSQTPEALCGLIGTATEELKSGGSLDQAQLATLMQSGMAHAHDPATVAFVTKIAGDRDVVAYGKAMLESMGVDVAQATSMLSLLQVGATQPGATNHAALLRSMLSPGGAAK